MSGSSQQTSGVATQIPRLDTPGFFPLGPLEVQGVCHATGKPSGDEDDDHRGGRCNNNNGKVGRLTNFHEAIAGRLAIPVRSALRPAGRNLGHTSTTNSYIPIPANKNCYKFSFIPRTIPEWNQLPNSITSIQDKTVFKTAAHNHLIKQSNQN